MTTTVTSYFKYDTNSVTSPEAGATLATVTLDDEVYLLNTAVEAVVTIYQTGTLGPPDNIKLVAEGVDLVPNVLLPAIGNTTFESVYTFLMNWSSPDAYPTVQLKTVAAALLTTYRVSLKVQSYQFD